MGEMVMERATSSARLSYTSKKHVPSMLTELNDLRRHRELCDIVLTIGSKEIFAHKFILSACSPYFKAMFTGKLAESRQTKVTIYDIDELAMELLIEFFYISRIIIEEANVQALLSTACMLQLTEIQNICCEFLKSQLDATNCLGIRALADIHSCRELLCIADMFIQHNFQEVMENEEFLLLPVGRLIDIISSDELNIRMEEELFSAIMNWTNYNLIERKQYLAQVLQHVRLPLISPKFLVGIVGSDLLVRSDDACRDLVDEAKNYLLLSSQEKQLMQGLKTQPRNPIKGREELVAIASLNRFHSDTRQQYDSPRPRQEVSNISTFQFLSYAIACAAFAYYCSRRGNFWERYNAVPYHAILWHNFLRVPDMSHLIFNGIFL